jgi:phage shock protein E
MNIFNQLFGSSAPANLQQIIDEGAYLVDVRSPGEFAQGHVKGSVNIPLDTIQSRLAQFKNRKNILVFCRSGNRSRQAKAILQQHGVSNVVDGGTVEAVSQHIK